MHDEDRDEATAIERDEGRRALAEIGKATAPSFVGALAALAGGPVASLAAFVSTLGLVKALEAAARVGAARTAREGDFWREALETAQAVRLGALPQDQLPGAWRRVRDAHRRAMRAVSAEAAPHLARLWALHAHVPHDAFFRSAARTLQDLTGNEIAELEAVARAIQRTLPFVKDGETVAVTLTVHPWREPSERALRPDIVLHVVENGRPHQTHPVSDDLKHWPRLREARRVFAVMALHGLGSAPRAGDTGITDTAITIQSDVAWKLYVLFNGAAALPPNAHSTE